MKIPEMRTRVLSHLANCEVEEYLDRNDIIFVPVGNVEMHGAFPMDVEYVQAEAQARLLAEQVDGLIFTDLLYFYAAGTVMGRGTVQMSPQDSVNYLLAIARSLLNQGFRRQIYIPSHGVTGIFVPMMIAQFFEETKVPLLYINPMEMYSNFGVTKPRNFIGKLDDRNTNPMADHNKRSLGAYKICGRMHELPVNAESNKKGHIFDENWRLNDFCPELVNLVRCSSGVLGISWYFENHINHGSPALPESREELEAIAEEGAKELTETANAMDFQLIVDSLRKLDQYMQQVVIPKHKNHLPRNRWSDPQ